VGIFLLMLVYLLILQRLPLRSPRAVPWTPPAGEKPAGAEPASPQYS
jgi:hypothetical protein